MLMLMQTLIRENQSAPRLSLKAKANSFCLASDPSSTARYRTFRSSIIQKRGAELMSPGGCLRLPLPRLPGINSLQGTDCEKPEKARVDHSVELLIGTRTMNLQL